MPFYPLQKRKWRELKNKLIKYQFLFFDYFKPLVLIKTITFSLCFKALQGSFIRSCNNYKIKFLILTFLKAYIGFIQFLVLCQQGLWCTCRLIVCLKYPRLKVSLYIIVCITRIQLDALPSADDSLEENQVVPKCPQLPSEREQGNLISQWAPASPICG